MRRVALLVLALVVPLVLAAPAVARKNTITVVRVKEPARANVTVAGFELDLVKVRGKKSAKASVASSLPKGVSVFAVLGKQKRSDRVRGVLVVANRAPAVTAAARKRRARRLRINLRHAAVPKGYTLKLKLHAANNVLSPHRGLHCSSYFKAGDLGGALKLGGPRLPNITTGSLIQFACDSAVGRIAYPGEGELLAAVNARSGALGFVRSPQAPNVVNGTASFNYPVKSFLVQADKGHQFTACSLSGGTCAITASDNALFTLAAPVGAGSALQFGLATAPDPAPALPFRFFGIDASGKRSGPLATTGP